MDTLDLTGRNGLIIVAGKGGVGKTTVAAVLATVVARAGKRVLIVAVDGGEALARLFDRPADAPIGYERVRVLEPGSGFVDARVMTSDLALLEWLSGRGMKRLGNRLASSGTLDVIATAAPGIEDILVLGRVKALVNERAYDLIVLDAPASGHAVTFLQSAAGLAAAAASGAIRDQARAVQELLADRFRCQVVSVTLPETTPIAELLQTTRVLEDRLKIALGPIVVNQMLSVPREDPRVIRRIRDQARDPVLAALARRRRRVARQQAQLRRLAHALPLPRVLLPALPAVGLTGREREQLADVFTAELTLRRRR
jgi:anion-transporting  ArsA/GET3 family ATPase